MPKKCDQFCYFPSLVWKFHLQPQHLDPYGLYSKNTLSIQRKFKTSFQDIVSERKREFKTSKVRTHDKMLKEEMVEYIYLTNLGCTGAEG